MAQSYIPLNQTDSRTLSNAYRELLVPVLDVSHRDVLAERTLPKAKMIKYLSDMVPGDFISGLGKFAPDLCLADGDPSHGLILRKAGHVGLYDPDHRPQPFRMLGQRGVTASSVPADASFPERVAGMQFLQSFLNMSFSISCTQKS